MVNFNSNLTQKTISERVEEDLGNCALLSQKATVANEETKSSISLYEVGWGKEAMDYLQEYIFNMID